MEVNKGYILNLIVSMGFMTVEFFLIHILIEKPSKLNQQTKIHHVIATTGYAISLYAGYGYAGLSNASLLCEYSSVFLNYKDMFKKHKDTPLGQLNQLMFLIFYTIFRVIFFPMLFYRCFAVNMMTFHMVSWMRKFCMILSMIQAFLVVLLQFYWYNLILKGLKRMLCDQGILNKGGEEDDKIAKELKDFEATDGEEKMAVNKDASKYNLVDSESLMDASSTDCEMQK